MSHNRPFDRLGRQSERILKSADEGICGIDLRGRITFANRAATTLLDRDVDDLIGRPFVEVVGPPNDAPVSWNESPIKAAIRDGAVHRVTEEFFWSRNGTRFAVEYDVAPIGERNATSGAVVIFRDVTTRRQAEADWQRFVRQLAVAEAKFRGLLESAPDAIVIVDEDGRIDLINHQAEVLFGYQRDELLRKSIELLVPDDLSSAHIAHRVRYNAEPRTRPMGNGFVLYGRRKDGSTFPAEISLSPTEESPGRFLVISVIRDITERQRADEERAELLDRERVARAAAEEAQRQFVFLAAASGLLAGSVDYQSTLREVGQLALSHFADGCVVDVLDDEQVREVAIAHVDPTKEALLQQLRLRFPIDRRRDFGVARVVSTGRSELVAELTDEWYAKNAPEAERAALLRALGVVSYLVVPLRARGRTIGAMSFVSSSRHYRATDLELAEDLARRCALAVENSWLHSEMHDALDRERRTRTEAEKLAAERAATLGQIADGVIIVNADGQTAFVNPAARRLLTGKDEVDAAVAIDSVDVFTGDGKSYPMAALPLIRAALAGETVVAQELRPRRPDGSLIVLEASAAPVRVDGAARTDAVVALHDVTARYSVERQKDEFLANVSHDLKTPLTGIKASIGVVLANEPPDTPEPLHRLLVNVDLAADRMVKLVGDLLELSRLQAGRIQLRVQSVDLRSLLTRNARVIETLAQSRGQSVLVDVPEEPVLAAVDVERLDQTLLNVLSNAQKYGRQGGVIRLRLESRPSEARLSVADDGPGIQAEDQERIFERFYRSEGELSRRNQGSGLGLPIARAMVELHGGRMWVESTPGAGATFWISLPLDRSDGRTQ